MQRTAVIARILVTLFGLALIVLGALFWSGYALSLVQLHILLGVLFVLSLWLLVVLAFLARAARIFALVVFVWGLIVAGFGMAQVQMLPGSAHWVIRAIHLLIGLIAIGLGHGLARRLLRRSGVAVSAVERA